MELAGQAIIAPEKLPPTENTAHFHGLRVHHQVMTWRLLDKDFSFEPIDWGWELIDGTLVPITNQVDISPPSLKSFIRCNCKITSPNPCGTRACTCFKYNIPCLPACKGCRGTECNNTRCAVHDPLEEAE